MKKLIEEIKNDKDNDIYISIINDEIKKSLKKNKNISLFDLEINQKRKLFSKRKKMRVTKDKTVKIKKFRSIFKKKSIEYIVADLNGFYDYYKYLASNSIYLCNNKIYVYGNLDIVDAKSVAKKFERYNTKIEIIEEKDMFLVIVDASKAKFNLIKEKFFIVIDTFINLGDLISYFLTS